MTQFVLSFVLLLSTSAFAKRPTEEQFAKWQDQVLAERAKELVVHLNPGKARIISVGRSAVNIVDRKIPGRIYWDEDCYTYAVGKKGEKVTCSFVMGTYPYIGEDGFGRFTMKSCYIGEADKVCGRLESEAAGEFGISSYHGSWGNVQCTIEGKTVNATYTKTNDYEGRSRGSITIAPCL